MLKKGDVSVSSDDVDLSELQKLVTEIKEKFGDDPQCILKAKGFNLDQHKDQIDAYEDILEESWYSFAAPGDQGEGLLNVLNRYPTFQKKVSVIKKLRTDLSQRAELPPKSLKEINLVKDLQKKLIMAISTLKGEGIDDEVVEFLQKSANGVPLDNLLNNKKVMKWIRDNNLIKSFKVTSL